MSSDPADLSAIDGPETGLDARRVSAGYPRRPVLQAVSVDVWPGDAIAVIGPNGSGKSTLVRVLAGSIRPTRGRVTLFGRDLSSYSKRELSRCIAVVPQRLSVGFGLLAREVVMCGRTPYVGFLGTPSAADDDAVLRALDDTDTADLADRPFASLSGGEAQRVVLAMALAQESRFLLLDEPTAHLDLGQQWKFLSHLLELRNRRNVGILAVIHDLSIAGTAFERVLLMSRGAVVADGAPAEVITGENIARDFRAPVRVWQDEDGVRVTLEGAL